MLKNATARLKNSLVVSPKMQFLKSCLVLSTFAFLTDGQMFMSCPFNKRECDCWVDYGQPKPYVTFAKIRCLSKDGQLPKFQTADTKYNVTGEFAIYDADLRVIPANHFSAFQSIRALYLDHDPSVGPTPAEIDWDDRAFDGVSIYSFTTNSLDGLIPAPASLRNLSVQIYQIANGHLPINLKEQAFKNLPDLFYIVIGNCTVQEIDPNAFFGLENQLEYLIIQHTNFNDLPSINLALKDMKRLFLLDLSNNSISEITPSSFLVEMRVRELHLSNNPIMVIEKNSFTKLKGMGALVIESISTLTEFDVAVFSNFHPATEVLSASIDNSKNVKTMNVSEMGKLPRGLIFFELSRTNVEIVDSKIGDLIFQYPQLLISIDQSWNLLCHKHDWLTEVPCPDRMMIYGSRCPDFFNLKLDKYLLYIDPQTKCREGTNSRLLAETTRNLIRKKLNN